MSIFGTLFSQGFEYHVQSRLSQGCLIFMPFDRIILFVCHSLFSLCSDQSASYRLLFGHCFTATHCSLGIILSVGINSVILVDSRGPIFF